MKLFSSGSKWLAATGVALLLMFTQQAHAQRRPVTYSQQLDGSSGQLAVDSSREVMDSIYLYPSSFPAVDNNSSTSIENMIMFYVDETSLRMPPDSFKVDIQIKVYFTNRAGASDSTAIKTLTIEYNKYRPYNSKALYVFKDAPRVKVKVLSVTESYATLSHILPLLKLENRMAVGRIFSMNCANDAITGVVTNTDSVAARGELIVSWPSRNAAQEYDLEWTFVDQTALDAGWYNINGSLNPDLLFRNNASRVTISGTRYKIPLLYEGDGKLFYRVRAAQTTIDGERKVTNWSSDHASTGGLGQYTFTGHERALNWQASTSFAEGGKHKSVVQYFDGTLRNRQTVTKDNATDTTIVAETFYDKQGRSAIQVLPAPSLTTLIKYNPLFNQGYINRNGTYTTEEYHQGQYDTLKAAADYCGEHAPPLSTTSGSSKYYSPLNQNKNELVHRYIPDAEMYPFTEVKYAQDNTGRIASQGGVGPAFKLNSGHETRYFYGTPSQQELDALFGTEAGYASHYQKNMVRDANGQYSVSYVDMHGRTVATALAGDTAALNLQALPSYKDTVQTDRLLTRNNNIVKGNSIQSANGLLVPHKGKYFFEYKLDPESLQLNDKNGVGICYDCLYDLTITITDDCNNQLLEGEKPFVRQVNNMQVAPPLYDTTCSAAKKFSDTFSLILKEGSYVVTKRLTLREDAMNWYRDSLYAPHNTVKTKEQVIAEQLELIRAQRGNDCVQEGEPWYEYQQYRERMLLDMTPPFGQYARYPKPAPVANQDPKQDWSNVYSIFQSIDINGVKTYNFEGIGYSEGTDVTGWTDEQFAYNFETEWAEKLLVLHPEYRVLQEYEKLKPSFHWDADFETTSTYAAAAAKGYLNPLNSSASPASGFSYGNDSLFYGGNNAGLKSSLKTAMETYISKEGNSFNLWTFASIMGHCDPQDATCVNLFKNTPSNAFSNTLMCEGERDMAWRFFRDQYLRLKRNAIADYVNTKAPRPEITAPATRVFVTESMARAEAVAFLGDDDAKAQQAGKDSLDAIAARSCENYVSYWWSQLSTCYYTAADSIWLMPRLIQICKEGADSTHPYGASSVRPESSASFRSFDELITYYNTSIGKPTNGGCNAYLIENPVPYNKPIAKVDQPWYSKPDNTTCQRISSLRAQYNASSGYSSFSDFLQQKLGTDISNADLNRLDSLCNGTFGCKFTTKAVVVPAALQATTGDGICVDCNQVNEVYKSFRNRFPTSIPSYQQINEQQQQTNQVFKNYMNSKLGFSKTALEYLKFLDTCGANTNCDSLQALVNRYNLDIKRLRVLAICQSNSLNPPLYLTDISESVTDGTLHWPKAIRDTAIGYFEYFQHVVTGYQFCLENGYAIEFKFKFLKDDIRPNEEFFYFTDINAGFVLAKREEGALESRGTFLDRIVSRDSATNQTSVVRSNGISFISSNPDLIFEDWTVIKFEVTPQYLKVYANGQLLQQAPRGTDAIKNWSGFTLAFMHYQAVVDWTKVYDANGKQVFFDDYLTNTTRQTVDPSFVCPKPIMSAEQDFTNYYNQQKGTSYTYAKIDSIYRQVCGKSPDIAYATSINKDTLNNIISRYNKNENPYRFKSFAQSNALTPAYHEDLNQITENGALQWPKAIRETTGRDWVYFQNAVYSPAAFCFQNGYSVEWRFKSLKEVLQPVDDVFYYQDANAWFAISRAETGAATGMFLRQIKGKSEDNSSRVDLFVGSILLDSDPDAIYKSWNKLKLTVTSTSIKIYYNGVLKKEVARTTAPLLNDGAFTLAFLDYQASIDWIKMYDASGNLGLFEDYNDPFTRSVVSPAMVCPQPVTNCQTPFVNYFNQQKSTSFTFSQIDSLYFANDIALNICGQIGYRDSLARMVDSFYVAAKPGQPIHDLETQEGKKYYNLADIAHDGVIYFPDSVRQKQSTWYNNYHCNFKAFCTNGGYTVETRFKFLDLAHYGDVFYLQYGAFTATFYYAQPGVLSIVQTTMQNNGATESTTENIIVDNSTNSILDWMTFKLVATLDKYRLYYNGKLVLERSRNSAYTFGNAQNFGLGLYGRYGAVDYIRVGNANDEVKFFEDFTNIARPATVDSSFICAGANDCQLAFQNYFNTKKGTSYSYPQIDSIYKKAGVTLDACNAVTTSYKDTLYRIVDSFYVNAKPGKVKHKFVTQELEQYNNLSDLEHNGILYLPDSIRQRASTWYNNYQFDFNAFCTNSGYTIESRFKFLDRAHYGDVFYLGYRAIQPIFFLTKVAPAGLYITDITLNGYNYAGYAQDSLKNLWIRVDADTNAILNWMTIKAVVKPDKYELYYNGKLVFERARNPQIPIANQENFGLGLYGRYGAVDYIRVGDVNGNTKYFEDFNDITRPATVDPSFICAGATDCQLTFKNYYNTKRGTSYSYAQIDSIYKKAGITLDACSAVQQVQAPSGLLLCGKNEPTNRTVTYEDIYDPPCSDSSILAYNSGTEIYEAYKDSLDQSFNRRYAAKCLSAASIESFTVNHPVSEYHYTLYYYDQAGNLVKTVAPAGVRPNRGNTWLEDVELKRGQGVRKVPEHEMPTVYRYNSLNQVVSQKTPDAGKSTNWYDRLGRLAVSQNAQQLIDGKYSYTVYDQLSRITEVGQKLQTTAMTNTLSRNPGALRDWIYYNDASNTYPAEMVTRTVYDVPSIDGTPCVEALRFTQKPYTLRNRVSYTRYFEKPSYSYNTQEQKYFITGLSYTSGIDYSYDIHGNVDTMRNLYGTNAYSPMTHHGANACKTIAYHYDLISGKVNEVHYNPGQNDEFYHRYEYDPENRLTDVYTTDNKMFLHQIRLEEHEARYTYYKHGPLARTVIGEQRVQGIDYIYNLQGWLKAINGSAGSTIKYEAGQDARVGTPNQYVAADVPGITLRYFTGDYKAINSSAPDPLPSFESSMTAGMYKPLYNGNISAMTTDLAGFATLLYNYKYDQLNRLVAMDAFEGYNTSTNSWESIAAMDDYRERYTYDGNGNILTAVRNGNLSSNMLMDNLTYHYYANSNRLEYISDAAPDVYQVNIDLKDQSAGNYVYDAIGNLTSSDYRSLNEIKWNVYGKIVEVNKTGIYQASAKQMYFNYDPSGNRIGQTQRFVSGGKSSYYYDWYVRDAQGNVMAVYEIEKAASTSDGTLELTEQYIYGSSRLGMIKRNMNVDLSKHTPDTENDRLGTAYLINFTRGYKHYELTNHLGNVMATVADVTIPRRGTYDDPLVVKWYEPLNITRADYSPFGMRLPGRTYNNTPRVTAKYRYGFNGKEADDEMMAGSTLDYGFRVYDARVGRFLSVDPLTHSYPWYTPYQYAGNTPIQAIDLDGLEDYIVTRDLYKNGATKKVTIEFTVKKENAESTVNMQFRKVMGGSLGDPLTDQKAVRIIRTPGEKDKVEYGNLTKEEESIKQRYSRKEPSQPTKDAWDILIKGQNYTSGIDRDESIHQDKIAEKNFHLIKNLKIEVGESPFYLNQVGEGGIIDRSITQYDYPEYKKFFNLPDLIKEDGGIKSINISFIYLAPGNSNDYTKQAKEGLSTALTKIKNDLAKMFDKKATGVEKVNINVEIKYDTQQVGSSPLNIELKR